MFFKEELARESLLIRSIEKEESDEDMGFGLFD
jgi:ribosomal protein L12E/L44/L45/RPP1/RPP2